MRRIFLTVILGLAIPVTALAAPLAAGDGSLALTSASGTIFVQGRGLIYGHVDSGTLMVLDYKPDDGVSAPVVSTGKAKYTKGSGVFQGSDMRFLLPSGRYTIELVGVEIDASGIGRGSIVATGLGTSDDGSYSVNGGKPQLLGKVQIGDVFGGKTPS